MKRIFGLLLLFVAFNVSAIEISSKLSGAWYNPSQDGHGLSVAVLDENRTLIFWYVYHTDGTPMFLITVGENQGNSTTGTTYYNTGMKFGEFNPDDRQQTVWGTSTVTFSDCNTATLEYSSNDPAYGSGSIPMVRLAFVSGLKCSDSPLHGNYLGIWVEPSEVGYGIAIFFENGDMVSFSRSDKSGGVSVGQWRVTGSNNFAIDVTEYSVFGGREEFSGSGRFSEEGLRATYPDNGEFFATPDPSFQHSLTTAKMAGTYDIHDLFGAVIGSATVESDGKVSGSIFDGCEIVGAINVPNTNFNQAYLDVQVSNCGDIERINGAAVYYNLENVIAVLATDGWTGYNWILK